MLRNLGYKGIDEKKLVSGQEVILLEHDPIAHVYSFDGDLIGMVKNPRGLYSSLFPLRISQIVILQGKYYLYDDSAFSHTDHSSSTFAEICDIVKVSGYENHFFNLEINYEINNPDDYPSCSKRRTEAESWDDKTVEVSYNVPWMGTYDDDFNIDLSKMDIKRLVKAEEKGEELTSDYISRHMKSVHKKIIKAIKNNMEEKSFDPNDGMVEEYFPPCFHRKVKIHPSHQDMLDYADDEEIEYFVTIY